MDIFYFVKLGVAGCSADIRLPDPWFCVQMSIEDSGGEGGKGWNYKFLPVDNIIVRGAPVLISGSHTAD